MRENCLLLYGLRTLSPYRMTNRLGVRGGRFLTCRLPLRASTVRISFRYIADRTSSIAKQSQSITLLHCQVARCTIPEECLEIHTPMSVDIILGYNGINQAVLRDLFLIHLCG